VLTDPVENLSKAEFVALHRADDERVTIQGFDLHVKAVPPEEDIGGGKSNTLITVDEAMVVAKRLHQRGSFFFNGIVIADLRTKNGGLNCALIAHTMATAEYLNQSMLHPVDFRHRKMIRHLLGKTLQQVTVPSQGLLEGIHYLGPDQVLRWNHVL